MVNFANIFPGIISKKQLSISYKIGLYIFILFVPYKNSRGQTTTIANGAVVTVSASTTITTPGDINIATGGAVKNSGSLQLKGSWTNNGSYTDVGGTVTFDAPVAGETISGLLTGANKFNDLIFNGSGSWTFADDAEVGGSLSLVNGVVTAPAGTLILDGNITQTGADFVHNNGSVILKGSLAQSYTAARPLTFYNLTNNNSFGLPGFSVKNNLIIENELQLVSLSKLSLVSGDIILRSTAANTANVAAIPAEANIITYGTGRFIVERYINIGLSPGQHGKSWQLLAAPAIGQTIKQSWMEGAGPNANPNPGFGTQITGAGGAANGFDAASIEPSMKFYAPASNTWTSVGNPLGTPLNNNQGYFLFVRGDRSVVNFSGINSNPLPTTLRTRGTLKVGVIAATPVAAGLFQSVGNPYASGIDLRSLSYGAGINRTVIVWDPTIGGAHGLGAYQTLFLSGGNYVNLLSSAAYGSAGTQHNLIQSGQAFLIQGVGAGGTLNFKEADKASGSNVLLFAPRDISENVPQFRTSLYSINADDSATLSDGSLIQYGGDYSNAIDEMDARKMMNSSENISIRSGGKNIVIERRQPVLQADTIFYSLTGLRAQSYRLEFIVNSIGNGMNAFAEDTYLQIKTPLKSEGTTNVDFKVTSLAGSYSPGRFRVVFAPQVVLPVTFISIKAYRRDRNINVEWKVENELNVRRYGVERSVNGIQFTSLASVPATGNNGNTATYFSIDNRPLEGYNYYRVKALDVNGKISYTHVVKVIMGSLYRDISVTPNPVTGGIIKLQLTNQPEGVYSIRLLNKLGQAIISRQINHTGGSSTELIKVDYKLAHGIYQLEITRPDGSGKGINVIY